jgi:hypothetical protein
MRLALAALLLLSATPAFADARTYTGTLGDRAILAELTEPEHGMVVGRFSYIDDGADVPLLSVSAEGNIWTLAEEAPCTEGTCIADDDGKVAEPPIAATWSLTVGKDRLTLLGNRVTAGTKAKSAPVALTFVAARPIGGEVSAFALHDRSAAMSYDTSIPLDWEHAPYEADLLLVALEHGEFTETNGIHWTYATDPRSGLTFPSVVLMTAEVHTIKIALETHFSRASLAAFDCKAFRYGTYGVSEHFLGLGGHTAGYEDEQVTLTYLSPTLASWSQEGSLYCQGAHPYNHLDNYTLDARTGLPLDWRRVFSAIVPRPWFSPPEDVVDVETALADPDSYDWGPSPELIDYVRIFTPDDLFEDDTELADICFSDQAIAEQLTMRVVGDGEGEIMFTLSGFPHVSSVCNGDLFSAKLTELRPFLAETAKDYFPVLGAKPQQ